MSALDRKKMGLKKGAVGYLTKPLTKNQILGAFDKMEAVIDKKVRRVLIVDDNATIQKALSSYLGREDIECLTAQTGDEALGKIKAGMADCVVLDMGLPDISGYDLLEKIKTSEEYGDIPVIIYTGKDLSRQEENKIKNYASAIVIKTANSYKRLLDETKLFLHKVDQTIKNGATTGNSKPYQNEKGLSGKTALIVDDDIRNIFALTKVLEAQNMEIISAGDGLEALSELENKPDFDVILMDIMMPNMDGYEAMQEIRKKPQFKNLPIIALTAKAMIGDREKCIKAGASDYISKPLDADKLLSLLRVWLYK
jgi:CheY-like chemotaxis protein